VNIADGDLRWYIRNQPISLNITDLSTLGNIITAFIPNLSTNSTVCFQIGTNTNPGNLAEMGFYWVEKNSDLNYGYLKLKNYDDEDINTL
jgi:hypothetical protein